MLSNIEIKDNILDDKKYQYIFSVDAVNELVKKGISFRDAYRQVGNDIEKGSFNPPPNADRGLHEGSIGRLCNDQIVEEMNKVLAKFA
jgi:argininosuccinate lyase